MRKVFSGSDDNLEVFSWTQSNDAPVNSKKDIASKPSVKDNKDLKYTKIFSANEENVLAKIKKEKNDITNDIKSKIRDDLEKDRENFQYFRSSFEEMEKIKKEAYEKGFNEGIEKGRLSGEPLGYKEGSDKAKKEHDDKLMIFQKNLVSSIENIGLFKEKILNNAKADVLELASMIAKKIIGMEISLQPKVLISIIENSLQSIVAKDKINIFLSKEDYEVIKNEKFTLYNAEKMIVTADSQLNSGEIRIESDLEQLSYSIDENVTKLTGALKDELI